MCLYSNHHNIKDNQSTNEFVSMLRLHFEIF
jgi:hypothetical protein